MKCTCETPISRGRGGMKLRSAAIVVNRAIPLPTEPGRYFWDEWKCLVDVYRKGKGKRLYVCPPRGIEIQITPRIAGNFFVEKIEAARMAA